MSSPSLHHVSSDVLARITVNLWNHEATALDVLKFINHHTEEAIGMIDYLQEFPYLIEEEEQELEYWQRTLGEIAKVREQLERIIFNETDPQLPDDL